MATGKKKTILAYFLQKTSGSYSESSLSYLHDLLRREGVATSADSIESLASELAVFVRDGSYLKISTKKAPEHIRAQIDFHLQKSRRTSKKTASSSSSSAFDDLLASIDSDDPKFTMDTTLGLGFSSLEELEADLKKHALDSLSPSMFPRDTTRASRAYSRDSYDVAPRAHAQDFADVDETFEQERAVMRGNRQPSVSQHNHTDLDSDSDSSDTHVTPLSSQSQEFSQQMSQPSFADLHAQHPVPQFPATGSVQQAPQFFSPVPSFSQASFIQNPATDLHSVSQKNEQQQFFAELQLRASLLDAKERLLSARIGSTEDPAVLRAVAMLDEKLLQFAQQQEASTRATESAVASAVSALSQSQSSPLSVSAASSTGKVQSLSAQIKSYVQELIGAQKSMHELQQVFAHTASNTVQHAPVQPQIVSTVQQITPAQARELAKKEKADVTQLRSQLSNLQEQFSQLSAQLTQSLQAQHTAHTRAKLPSKIKSLKTTAVHAHTLRSSGLLAPQRQLALQNDYGLSAPATFGEDRDVLPPTLPSSETEFESDAPTLQKMYALLAVGMRELTVSPQRARHIYEQLQRLYTTLSFDQKPIIYPSIVEFYASLTNQMRGVQ